MEKRTLTFHRNGTLSALQHPRLDLAPLGAVSTCRVSLVRPLPRGRRLFFALLRRLFGDQGRVAAWTRRWPGPWEATIIATRQTHAHPSRAACIAWEENQLDQ